MAEPFKNMLNRNVVEGMASHFQRHYHSFDEKGFIKSVLEGFEALELKQRTERITQMMVEYLPEDFSHAVQVMEATLGPELIHDLSAGGVDDNGISGWAIMPMADYVAIRGQDHFDMAMTMLEALTKRSSSEFAIRHFLLNSPEETMQVLASWATSSNHHVRRLASEGCRPRLPWGIRLKQFIDDPMPVIKLLEQLKDDDEEYVRRSVANNLNDIAKDHPDLVADIAENWLDETDKNRQRLLRHACRTLIKQGHKKTLATFGYTAAKLQDVELTLHSNNVILGDQLQFTLSLESSCNRRQNLMVDYIIHHQKANGSLSPKVFKWRTTTLSPNESDQTTRKHAIRPVTTRKYYPGLHRLEIVINGESVASQEFTLTI